MTVLDPRAMSDQTLEQTAHALANALTALAQFAIAAGVTPGLVRRYTGSNVTNTSRPRKQTFNHLVAKLNQALVSSGCVPLLDVRARASATAIEVIYPTIRQPFVDELMKMADALQQMKYVLMVELDARTLRCGTDIASIDGWHETVQPHIARCESVASRIIDEVEMFDRARTRYIQLARIGQISWSSRRSTKDRLFVAQHKIADLLVVFADCMRSTAREASMFDRMFHPSQVRRLAGAWRTHADRVWDQRVIAKGNRDFRKTAPSYHPLTDILSSKSSLARSREDWRTDYQRAYQALQPIVSIARSRANEAESFRELLLSNGVHASAAVDLGYGCVLKIRTVTATAHESTLLGSIPDIAVDRT